MLSGLPILIGNSDYRPILYRLPRSKLHCAETKATRGCGMFKGETRHGHHAGN